ncbi:MAG: hypothetical protein EOO88_56330 [Pedobacter sp.]|nr:MAG: hypothetical protein EOO88_56330 [Pedobacter sp.]
MLEKEPKAYKHVRFIPHALQSQATTQIAMLMIGLQTSLRNIDPGSAARERVSALLLATTGQA